MRKKDLKILFLGMTPFYVTCSISCNVKNDAETSKMNTLDNNIDITENQNNNKNEKNNNPPEINVNSKIVSISTHQENGNQPLFLMVFFETDLTFLNKNQIILKLKNDSNEFHPFKINKNQLIFKLEMLQPNIEYEISEISNGIKKFDFSNNINLKFKTKEKETNQGHIIQNNEMIKPEQNKPNPNKKDNFGQVPPFIIPPNFPGFKIPDRTKENSYPEYVKKFKKVDEKIIYQEIYDRSFAVKFGINQGVTSQNQNPFRASELGTTWLLDYHKYNENKYKLFFATNLHVMSDFSNSLTDEQNKALNYEDFRGFKVESISLGKSDLYQTDFPQRKNKYSYSKTSHLKTKYYASSDEFTQFEKTDNSALETTKSNGFISKPKLIFAGYDFIDRQYMNWYQQDLKQKVKDKIKYIESKNEDLSEDQEYQTLKKVDDNYFIPAYVDFGVFEIDVDLSQMDETLKKWITKSIEAVDKYIDRLNKTEILPNQDKSISKTMQTIDYVTAAFEKDDSKLNLKNAKDLYIGGYPSINESGFAVWVRNNPTERNSSTLNTYYRIGNKHNDKTFAYPTYTYNERVTNGNLQPYTTVFGRTLADFYGFNLAVNFSSLKYGASGSMVYNEFGQLVGIYNQVSSNVEDDDLLRDAKFTSFLLARDYGSGEKVIKAYNLIDGTDKSKYPAQTKSYRQNLITLYPNGFENSGNNNFKTALFPEGFKK
ncbi:MIP family Ig-specific serine endopeptidase [Mycoplasmopsis cynos]|uniref:MIP family Ig-specific serine endopeptidase n=1 Tax=Mycoplasmopsis cynos TaxID=171284 RepID=UPI002AFEE812|nr:DUF31 family protein [Mycoplasmopsis cynos]WQQ14447.1 DUF31 family protein [Mycoplasmopsis cynos]